MKLFENMDNRIYRINKVRFPVYAILKFTIDTVHCAGSRKFKELSICFLKRYGYLNPVCDSIYIKKIKNH